MVAADETPIRESGLSNGKAERQGKKSDKPSEKRSRKPRQKAAKPEQILELPEETSALAAGVESSVTETGAPVETVAAEPSPLETAAVEPAPAETAAAEPAPAETAAAEPPQAETAAAEPAPAETVAIDPAPSAEAPSTPAPVSLQTIGNAVGDYTLKTFEQTSSFFEQLARARSIGRAVELQTQYARQALETFVAESEKIQELHREMARQRWQKLESLVAGTKTRAK
jgi:hypothetical protein